MMAAKTDSRLKLVHRDDGWWIISAIKGVDDMGPFFTRVEAAYYAHSVTRFARKERL